MSNKNKNLQIILTVGLPASGKSTWAKERIRKSENFVRINRDDIRMMLKNQGQLDPNLENMVTDIQHSIVNLALSRKQNIIIDNTHLKRKYITDMIEKYNHRADIEFMVFDVPADKCIERDKLRSNSVGEAVITKFAKDFKTLKDIFVFQNYPKVKSEEAHFIPNRNPNLPQCVIFDIDGTLALMKDRGPFDWNKVDNDDPNEIVIEHVKFHKSLGRKVFVVSGRDEVSREKTEYWLNFYKIEFDALFMRPKDDYRKDSFIKEEIFDTNFKDKYDVVCVYDDRLQVLEKWYELGIFTFNVNQGNKEF